MDRDKYLSHIQDIKEITNMRRILDKVDIVRKNYLLDSTDFFNPYTRRLGKSILNRFYDISYKEIGGPIKAERKIFLIYPDYHYLTEEDYPISAIRLIGDMTGLTHRDFLGSIIGLGITRDKLGDIFLSESSVDIVVKKEIKDFILLNLNKVGNNNFKTSEINLGEVKYGEDKYKEIYQTLSSSRLDAYLAATYNLSRKDSQFLIETGKAKVNWEPIEKPFYEVKDGDMVSVRGYGRSSLYSIDGLSKKNRLKVRIRILL